MGKQQSSRPTQSWDVTSRNIAAAFGFKPEHFSQKAPAIQTLEEQMFAARWETFHLAQAILFACEDAGFYDSYTGKFKNLRQVGSKSDKAMVRLAKKAKTMLNRNRRHD